MSTQPVQPTPVNVPPPRSDSASEAFGQALNVSFALLKGILVLLLLLVLFSGVFTVPSNHVAFVFRFGQPVMNEAGTEPYRYQEGLHLAFMRPIDHRVEVPITRQEVSLDSFWPNLPEQDRLRPISQVSAPANGLRPGLDGALMTADQNLVHARLVTYYRISDPAQLIRTVLIRPEDKDARPERELVIRAVQGAAVFAAGRSTADEIIRSQRSFADLLEREAQRRLDMLAEGGVGVTIEQINVVQPIAPLQVMSAFEDVIRAEQEQQQQIDAARQQATERLQRAAGGEYEALVAAIDAYRQLRAENPDADPVEVNRLLRDAKGEVANRLALAQAEATRFVTQLQSQATEFQELYPEYRQNPAVLRMKLMTNAMKEILSSPNIETSFVPVTPSTVIRLNARSAEVIAERERDRVQREQAGQQ